MRELGSAQPTAVELEILTGTDRRASPPRDSIAIYRLLELFTI